MKRLRMLLPLALFLAVSVCASLFDVPAIAAETAGKGTPNVIRDVKLKRQEAAQRFKRVDRNNDGFLTLEEFIGNPKLRNVPVLTKRFKKLDANGDGKLNLDEMK